MRVFLPVNAGATWNDLCFAISSVPLPIELNNVAAKLSNNTFSHIKWQTSHEETTKEFILERSIDGYKFTDIATVKSKNSAQMSEYEYVDNISNLEPGEIYYRIKEVNFSAKVNISRIVFVTKLASFISNVTIKPNPSAGVYKVSLNLQDDSEIKVNVVNIFGQHIISNASNLVKGNNAIQLDLSAFQKGIYFIQIVGKESFITEKVILVK
ncbi:MAG: T9SS type A sorting domain-containing protein [Bacteroidetes bacterium]|nr:T9SS type A sorting domain-containing protein [Bacteroidota bacterium]